MNVGVRKSISLNTVEQWLTAELKAGRLQGGVVEIFQNSKSVFSYCFGTSDGQGFLPTRQTAYWVASITKPIVSVAAMLLIERGLLHFEDPVSDYIPGFGENGVMGADGSYVDAVRAPTIHDLLTHMSGATYGQFGNSKVHKLYRQSEVFDYGKSNEEISSLLAAMPLLYQPGTVFEYGMSTDLLGHIIEIITKRYLDDALKELIFKPLSMKNTGFAPCYDVASFPASLVVDQFLPPLKKSPIWLSGGAGLFTTSEDYLKFTQFLLRSLDPKNFKQSLFQSRASMSLMLQDHLPENVGYGAYTEALGVTAPWASNGLSFGLGFAVRTKFCERIPGGIGEFLWPGVSGANFWVDPENDLIVVFMTHAPDYRAKHRIEFRNAVYASLGGQCDS